MTRRELLQLASALAAPSSLGWLALPVRGQVLSAPQPNPHIRRVLVVFKCHLDVGFTDTQANVMQTYFKQYYPQAMATASRLRKSSADRYIWTTGSWLLYEYLEQASAAERGQMEQAIAAGDIAWHALPFSWQTELFDRSMAEGCLAFSRTLDARFGRRTIAGKMTDVPGHTRGLVSVLAESGVRLLDIGVNPASTPPEVPEVFTWADAGHAVTVLYHRHDYGSVIEIPGSDMAVAVEVRSDNSGPHPEEEIRSIYTGLRARFPAAHIQAATLSEVALALDPVQATLPVVTGEIGDTWIYGAPSDPLKMARFREIARLRQDWIRTHDLEAGGQVDRNLLRRLALAGEHTWGTDTKRFIDHTHYAPKDLAAYLDAPNYKIMEHSWQEKRDDISAGIASLPSSLRGTAEQRLRTLAPTPPSTVALRPAKPSELHRTKYFEIALDPSTGAMSHLTEHTSKQVWADGAHPLALFTYQTLSGKDYDTFLANYVRSHEWWAPQDFGKPNIEKLAAESRSWHPRLQQVWAGHDAGAYRIVAELGIHDAEAEARGLVAWPEQIFLELAFPDEAPRVELRLSLLRKAANRMPEAMWLTFAPSLGGGQPWSVEKLNEVVRCDDVLAGGGRTMHGVTERLGCGSGVQAFEIATLDAPVVAFGDRSPLNFSRSLPDFSQGAHVCLFNNAWGTNYPQWAAGDWLFRFVLRRQQLGVASQSASPA